MEEDNKLSSASDNLLSVWICLSVGEADLERLLVWGGGDVDWFAHILPVFTCCLCSRVVCVHLLTAFTCCLCSLVDCAHLLTSFTC